MNPFVKFRGLKMFGVVEQAKGQASTETSQRTWNQYAVDGVYRFLADEKLFVGARYNKARAARRAHGRRRRQALRAERRLVHHPQRDGEGRIPEADILRVSREQHQERRRVQGHDARRRDRLLGPADKGAT